jgi:hypothetical protein
MKSKRLFISLVCLLVGISAYSQERVGSAREDWQKEVRVPSFKLVPTESTRVFLKLDTRRGLIEMVQYGSREKDRQETTVNYLPLATGADAVPGRFDLYPTEYVRTYILLDVLDGRTWQVVWSYDGTGELFPINNLPSKYY